MSLPSMRDSTLTGNELWSQTLDTSAYVVGNTFVTTPTAATFGFLKTRTCPSSCALLLIELPTQKSLFLKHLTHLDISFVSADGTPSPESDPYFHFEEEIKHTYPFPILSPAQDPNKERIPAQPKQSPKPAKESGSQYGSSSCLRFQKQ